MGGAAVPTLPIVQPTLTTGLVVQADEYATRLYMANEKAAATRRAYASDFRSFANWCQARDIDHLPAEPETVAAFMAS